MAARRTLEKRPFRDIDRGAFGGLLFRARKQRRRTQAQVAGAIGRDRPWLSDVETGKVTHVPDDDVRALALTLDLDPGQLLATRDRARAHAASGAAAASMHRPCPACAHLDPSGANYCSNCGRRLPGAVACATCRQRNDALANFCNNCGSALLTPPGHDAAPD